MAGNLITSLLSLTTNLLPSIRSSAQASSSSSSKRHARAVEEDLERLMRTMERIKATLYDAEEREIIDRSVKLWLKELKMVAYDAEDLLSEYRYEVTRVQLVARKASQASGFHKRKQMEDIVPIPDGMVDHLNNIRNRFDEIEKDREALQLRESDGARRLNNKILRPLTSHMVDEMSIFGRDDEITKVINFLLSEKEKSFSVISIIGKGGLGKTTIAQLVYKDQRISRYFDLFGWVCVSEEFDIRRLIKATIESVSKSNCHLSELSPLQEELAKIVKGKRILLVLDDVWNENQSLWELFHVSFKEAKMVRILVTTRNRKVAEVMQTTVFIRPTNLPEDSCWQLFQHYAFIGTSDTVRTHLVCMGRKIMRKCGGLQLAVKSIASLLSYKTDEESWVEILESDIWESNPSNDIFPALQISYAHLPAHLKLCFLMCSMYPKDYTLGKMELVAFWISHGYIESRGKRRITDIGVEYYEELKGRSFLDNFSNQYCKLHDIIHDLARLNSENEHYSVEINQPLDIQEVIVPRETYHLYVRGFMGYVNEILQQNLKGLRTLSIDLRCHGGVLEHQYFINNTEAISPNSMSSEYYEECFGEATSNLTKCEALRVLELKGGYLIKIPPSIFKLKHLAYLHITFPSHRNLPFSIGLLYNLQTFIVDVPESHCYLSLDVPHSLVIFPAIKTMKARLRVSTLGWLKHMKDLEGNLYIEKLKYTSNLVDARDANLRNKSKLDTLDLCWDSLNFTFSDDVKSELLLRFISQACDDELVDVDDVDFSLLECLQPHPNLKKLRLRYYRSDTILEWMMDPSSLQSIQQVWLQSCSNIEYLPFENSHHLKELMIVTCFSIRVLHLVELPSQLEKLQIVWCPHLELITGLGNLDMLVSLEISFCQTLKSLKMDGHGLQLVESAEKFGDSSHERPHIGRQSILSLTWLLIEYCDLLCVLPDGLIPSGPCYVRVHHCGCPNVERN